MDIEVNPIYIGYEVRGYVGSTLNLDFLVKKKKCSHRRKPNLDPPVFHPAAWSLY
jgi:hypothetical protein